MPPKKSSSNKAKQFSAADVKKHNSEDDCWVSIHGKVYDVTKFLDDHPGGPEIIITEAGSDATEGFEEVFHSDAARDMLKDYLVGELKGYKGGATRSTGKSSAASSSDTSPLLYILPIIIVIAAVAYTNFA